MPKFLKILFNWLPALIGAIRQILKLLIDYRLHRIQMKKLKKELKTDNNKASESGSMGIPEREPE